MGARDPASFKGQLLLSKALSVERSSERPAAQRRAHLRPGGGALRCSNGRATNRTGFCQIPISSHTDGGTRRPRTRLPKASAPTLGGYGTPIQLASRAGRGRGEGAVPAVSWALQTRGSQRHPPGGAAFSALVTSRTSLR